MEPDHSSSLKNGTTVAVVILLLIAVALLGWWLGATRPNRSGGQSPATSQEVRSTTSPQTNGTDSSASDDRGQLKSFIAYRLPENWQEFTCPSESESVYIAPDNATGTDCSDDPIAPIVLSVDASRTTDCNQLQNVQNVSKHICKSEYINGSRSLNAETVFNDQSSYKQTTTIRAYYLDTGRAVIKASYRFTSDDAYQQQFEEVVKSITSRS